MKKIEDKKKLEEKLTGDRKEMTFKELKECIKALEDYSEAAINCDVEFYAEDEDGNIVDLVFDGVGQFGVVADSTIRFKLPKGVKIIKTDEYNGL